MWQGVCLRQSGQGEYSDRRDSVRSQQARLRAQQARVSAPKASASRANAPAQSESEDSANEWFHELRNTGLASFRAQHERLSATAGFVSDFELRRELQEAMQRSAS